MHNDNRANGTLHHKAQPLERIENLIKANQPMHRYITIRYESLEYELSTEHTLRIPINIRRLSKVRIRQ